MGWYKGLSGVVVGMLQILLVAAALAGERDVVRTDAVGVVWNGDSTWKSDGQPDRFDRVLIPGRPDQRAAIIVEHGAGFHRAATLMVGRSSGSDGSVEVHGLLRVAGPNLGSEKEAGRFYVGGVGGTGAVLQYPGSDVYVSKALRLGYDDSSRASYFVQGGRLRARQAISIAEDASAQCQFHMVGGDAEIETNNLIIGKGTSTLVFEADADGISPITVDKSATLSGALRVNTGSGSSAEITLIDLARAGDRAGGFGDVAIDSSTGRHFEISYSGGNGNDVVLREVPDALVSFEDWQDYRFASSEPNSVRGAYADPDGDGLPNVGEYKLSRSPVVDEGAVVTGVADRQSYVRYTQRTDRRDVKVMVEASVGGGLWSGSGVRSRVIATYGNTETVEAWVDDVDAELRLAFASDVDRPNILFILVDDMGWADNEMNDPTFYTPTIKHLSEGGVSFSNHYVSPQCTPTRVALLTGCNPGRFGTQANFAGSNRQILPMGTPTLGNVLEEAGYSVGLVGKWHLGSIPQQGPGWYGFKESYGSLAGGVGAYDHRYRLRFDTIANTWHRNSVLIDGAESAAAYTPGHHVTDLLTDEAERFLRREHERPFFLKLAYTATHTPLAEEPKWFNDPEGRINQIANPDRRLLAATAYHLDSGIRRVIDTLTETGQRENTLVIFSSDNGGITRTINGDSFPAPDPTLNAGFSSNGPLRGQKGETYEGGIRVPAFANWPTQLAPRVETQPVQIADWFTTLCTMVAEVPEGIDPDGIDIWPTITTGEALPSRDLYFSIGKKWTWFGLQRDGWKIVSGDGGESWELFDLTNDPNEQTDLAGSYPSKLNELITRVESHWAEEKREYLLSGWVESPEFVQAGESINAKVRFSEVVEGLDESRILIEGGRVQSVSGSDREFDVVIAVDGGADVVRIELLTGAGESPGSPRRLSDASSQVTTTVTQD